MKRNQLWGHKSTAEHVAGWEHELRDVYTRKVEEIRSNIAGYQTRYMDSNENHAHKIIRECGMKFISDAVTRLLERYDASGQIPNPDLLIPASRVFLNNLAVNFSEVYVLALRQVCALPKEATSEYQRLQISGIEKKAENFEDDLLAKIEYQTASRIPGYTMRRTKDRHKTIRTNIGDFIKDQNVTRLIAFVIGSIFTVIGQGLLALLHH